MTAGLCLPVVMIAWALQFLDLTGSKANEITFSQENTHLSAKIPVSVGCMTSKK